MIDVKRLRKIMEEKGTDPDVSMHDLVREVLKRDYDKEDYSIKNVSEPDENEDSSEDSSNEAKARQGSIIHRNFAQVEENFRVFLKEGRKTVKLDAYDKEASLVKSIEEFRVNSQRNWTHHLKANPSNENQKL